MSTLKVNRIEAENIGSIVDIEGYHPLSSLSPQIIPVSAGQSNVVVNTYTPGTNTQLYYLNNVPLFVDTGEIVETNATTVTLTTPPVSDATLVVITIESQDIGTAGASNISYNSTDVGRALDNFQFDTLAEMAAVTASEGTGARIQQGGRAGSFRATTADISSEVTNDPQKGIYVAFASDPTGASGGWVRQYGQALSVQPEVKVNWFGTGEGDDTAALLGAVANGKQIRFGTQTLNLISKITIPAEGRTFVGDGPEHTVLSFTGNFTAIEHTTNFKLKGIRVEQTSTGDGIGFATPVDDASSSQAAYCEFENFQVEGFAYSFWWRASLWCSLRDGYSKSIVGLRLARAAQTLDLGLTPAPDSWNIFNPTLGFFHNVGVVERVVFEDTEAGIWGCPMSYSFISVTAQGQNGDPLTNTLLPNTVNRTGAFLHSGVDGTQHWGNTFHNFYTENTDVPLTLEDQRSVIIDGLFTQGGDIAAKFHAPIVAKNSTVELRGGDGQDWFDFKCVLTDNSILYGFPGGAVGGDAGSIEAGSRWVRYPEYADFVQSYEFAKNAGAPGTVTLPFTLQDGYEYRLTVSGLHDGFIVRHATYEIFRWNSDALTTLDISSGSETSFNVSVSSAQLVVNLTETQSFNGRVLIEKVREFAPDSITLPVA